MNNKHTKGGHTMRYSNEFRERHTYMDTRREHDKKVRRELIGGMAVMVVAFGMMIIAMRIWG